MRKRSPLIAAVAAIIVTATVVTAQRSSPQFTFSSNTNQQQNANNNQFGLQPDVLFNSNVQDFSGLGSPSANPNQGLANSAGPQSLSFASQLGSGSQLPPMLPPFEAPASEQQNQQNSGSLLASFQAQQQPSGVQLARPSLSLSSFQASAGQIQSQQPQLSQPSSPSLRSSNQLLAASLPQPTTSVQTSTSSSISTSSSSSSSRASSRQQQPQQQQSRPKQSSSRSQQQQQQATNSASAAISQQAAIEAARKAEASASSAAASSSSYSCPDSFGFFRHHKSCDKYWACENGTATLKLCGNGLMFDDSDPKRENCAYPFSVDCGNDRTDLEAPISTPHCPRLYGLFADTANCRVFYSCWNGEASKYECPPGLAYDNEQRVCVWADLVDRCDQSEVSDGFVCPDSAEVDQPGHYTRHAHPTDCRKFYVCIDGTARPYGCSFGSVFNVDSLQCDEPENVGGCEKYYGDLDPKLAKKLARENAQQQSGNPPSTRQQSSSSSSSSSSRSSASSTTSGGAQPTLKSA